MMSSIGFGTGMLIGLLIAVFSLSQQVVDGNVYFSLQNYGGITNNSLANLVINMLVSGLYGMLAMGGSTVYSIESWGILKCTVVHYLVTMIGFFAIAFSFRWYTGENLVAAFITFLIMTVVYAMIWFGNYITYKIQLEQINRELAERKNVIS